MTDDNHNEQQPEDNMSGLEEGEIAQDDDTPQYGQIANSQTADTRTHHKLSKQEQQQNEQKWKKDKKKLERANESSTDTEHHKNIKRKTEPRPKYDLT